LCRYLSHFHRRHFHHLMCRGYHNCHHHHQHM
jgi:hypothetical protein